MDQRQIMTYSKIMLYFPLLQINGFSRAAEKAAFESRLCDHGKSPNLSEFQFPCLYTLPYPDQLTRLLLGLSKGIGVLWLCRFNNTVLLIGMVIFGSQHQTDRLCHSKLRFVQKYLLIYKNLVSNQVKVIRNNPFPPLTPIMA